MGRWLASKALGDGKPMLVGCTLVNGITNSPEAAKTVAPEITGGVGQPAVGIGFVNCQRRDDKAVFDCHAVVEGYDANIGA